MTTNHKKVELFDEVIQVKPGMQNFETRSFDLQHIGKANHKINYEFSVEQPDPRIEHKIHCHIFSNRQLTYWFINNLSTYTSGNYLINHLGKLGYSVESINDRNKFNITTNVKLFFVIDNWYFSTITKNVKLRITEEWDQDLSDEMNFLSTIPPYDKSLLDYSQKMVKTASENLKIITPYIDMSLIALLLEKHDEKIDIKIITRDRNNFSGKSSKEAYEHIHKKLGNNHKHDNLIHSRIIIRDDVEALVSSADLTQDSLLGQFNAGIATTNNIMVNKLLDYFQQVWNKSSL